MAQRYAVWFERPIAPDLLSEVQVRAKVHGPGTTGDPYEGCQGARAAIAGSLVYEAEFMDRTPDLAVIVRTGIGVDKVDVVEATRRGIAVCNTPDGPTASTAEHALALILAVAKNIKGASADLAAGHTDLFASHAAIELDGKTIGLVGYGRIARRLAVAAHGIGMRVVAHDPFLDPSDFVDVERVGSLQEMLAEVDVVSVHMPLTPQNAGLFDAALFSAMRVGAIFVNTARGGLVDNDALLEAIDSGRLAGAGLDVTEPEPLAPDHPLLHRDNVVVTPHVASATHEGKRRMFRMAFEQAIQVLDGQRPAHLVNPEVWDRPRPSGRNEAMLSRRPPLVTSPPEEAK